ncbi:MAG: endo-1,4-beta-xylanase [Planctomycetaceae bacterium]
MNRRRSANARRLPPRYVSAAFLMLVGLAVPAAALAEPPLHPAVEAFFASSDPVVRETVLPGIERHRKADATLEVVDGAGRPVAGARVRGRLVRHRFLFGACPPERHEDLAPRFVEQWAGLVNFGVTQNAFKWSSVERERGRPDFGRIDRLLDLCDARGVALEYHFLTGYHPEWLAEVPEAERGPLQRAFAREIVARYRGRIRFFQVYNEDWLTHVKRARVFFDQTAFFRELAESNPDVKFGVSDCWTLDGTSPPPDPAEAKARYPGIAFIAAHAHRPRRLWPSPLEMLANFGRYTDSGVMLHLSEYGIDSGEIEGTYRSGTWDEQRKAECFVQVCAVAFSHPAVEAINHWDMGPGVRSRTYNAMLEDDLTPKPCYTAVHDLIHRRFATAVDDVTDAAGRLAFRGFQGRYELTVEAGDRHREATLDLAPGGTAVRIAVE